MTSLDQLQPIVLGWPETFAIWFAIVAVLAGIGWFVGLTVGYGQHLFRRRRVQREIQQWQGEQHLNEQHLKLIAKSEGRKQFL